MLPQPTLGYPMRPVTAMRMALDALEQVGGRIRLGGSSNMTSFSLTNLTYVGGDLILMGTNTNHFELDNLDLIKVLFEMVLRKLSFEDYLR